MRKEAVLQKDSTKGKGGIGLWEAGGHSRFWESYLIIKKLGSGGDGTVYLVKHIATEQLRAAKQIHTGKKDCHELQMMKRLHHPSLPEIIDVLEEDGGVWLILEYVRGEAIQNYAGEKLTPEIFFSFAEQLTEVVFYLHSRAYPILHLDIKPSNILVRKNGRIVLIDFGAAVHAGQTKTSEECRGTPGFAAPEQYQSNARLDGKTDVYGIGAVLFYLLSGSCYLPSENPGIPKTEKQWPGRRLPFERKKTKDHPVRWRKEAYRVVTPCLEKESKKRYPDCKALLEEIRRARKRWTRSKRLLPLSGALVLLILLTCFGGAMWLREEAKNREKREITAETLLEAAKGLGVEAACEKYKEVLRLNPEDTQVLFQVLEQILDDFRFTMEEERNLQELLLMIPMQDETVQEKLEEDPLQAGTFFYRLGLAYWYFYEGSGGRSAGASWFQRAARFGEESKGEAEWLESARIYTELSAYYDSLGKREEKGDIYTSLWMKLVQLWNSPGLAKETVQVRTEVAEELLACVVMGASKLYEDEKEVGGTLAALEQFLGEEVQDTDKKEEFQAHLESARTAWQRAGMAFERR